MIELFQKRHSGREYNGDRDLPDDVLMQMVEAARWAPSCYGEEPWRFLMVRQRVSPKLHADVLGTLAEPNRVWAANAPVLVIVMAKRQWTRNQEDNFWATYDTGAAAENMMLQGTALNVLVHPMGGFSLDAIRGLFGISDQYHIMAVMALGYEKDNPQLVERKRSPAESRFFWESWSEEG